MESITVDDLLSFPFVLESNDLNFTNCSSLQFEVSEEAVPLVILDNKDHKLQTITDSPHLFSSSISDGHIFSLESTIIRQSSDSSTNVNEIKADIKSSKQEKHNLIEDFIETVTVYKCKLCAFKTPDRSLLATHIKSLHLKNAEKKEEIISRECSSKGKPTEKLAFMCGKCSVPFASFSDWRTHLLHVHKIEMGVKDTIENETLNGGLPVNLENRQKKSKQPLETSKSKFVVPKKEKKNVCPVENCTIRLSSRDFVEKHRECHANHRQFVCPYCSQQFRQWSECANHLWKSHSQDVDLYSCTNCEFKTALRTKLEVHIKVHSNEREYLCTECGKSFKQAFQLQNHRVTHMKISDPSSLPNWSKKQECSICKRTFSDSKSLKKHIQTVHSNLRPYVCNVCGHTSALKNRMTVHLRQHTGEKPFSCPFCPFTTGDQNCLRRHAWRHSRVRPYSCPHCEYSCIQSNSLKNHIKTQHPTSSGVFSCKHCSFTSLSKNSFDSHLINVHDLKTEGSSIIYLSTLPENALK